MKKISIWKNMILWLIVIAALAMVMMPHRTVSTEAFNEYLMVQGNSGYTTNISYNDVESIELRENMDYGKVVDGVDKKKEKSGVWENEEFEEYQLCINASVSNCIVFYTTDDHVIVVNYESEQSTKSLYDAVLDKWASVSTKE